MTEKKLVTEQMMLTFAYDHAYMPKPKGWPLVYRVNSDKWNGVEVVSGHEKADPAVTVRDLIRRVRADNGRTFKAESSQEAGTFILEAGARTQFQARGLIDADFQLSYCYVAALCEVTLDEAKDEDKRMIHHIKVLGSLSAVFGNQQQSLNRAKMQEVYPDEPIPEGEFDPVTLYYDFTEKFSLSPSLVIEANGEQLDIALASSNGALYRPGT